MELRNVCLAHLLPLVVRKRSVRRTRQTPSKQFTLNTHILSQKAGTRNPRTVERQKKAHAERSPSEKQSQKEITTHRVTIGKRLFLPTCWKGSACHSAAYHKCHATLQTCETVHPQPKSASGQAASLITYSWGKSGTWA